MCERFHVDGAARIYVADIDFEAAEKVAESVGGKAFKLDVADEANCQLVVRQILDELGRLDFIASNAGIGGAEGLLEVSNEDWRNIFEVNVLSHVFLARASYSATKHAAVALAENMSLEFFEQGIYVSCLCPQGVITRLIDGADNPNKFLMADAITVEQCADAVIKALEAETFLILPHAEVAEYIVNKAENRDRWLHKLRKMRRFVLNEREEFVNKEK